MKSENLKSWSDDFLDKSNDLIETIKSAKRTFGAKPKKPQLHDQSKIRRGDNVPKNLLGNQEGFYFGMIHNMDVIKPHEEDGNIVNLGRTGDGKGTTLLNRTLERTRTCGVFATDIDGALTDYYKTINAPKRPFKVINLMSGKKSQFRFDLFQILREAPPEELIPLVRELALAIIPLTPDTREPFWIQAAQNILTGAIIHYFYIGLDFAKTMNNIQTLPLATLINDISENEIAKIFVNQFASIQDPSESKMLQSIQTELSNHIIPLATDWQIIETFTPAENPSPENTVTWNDFATHHIFVSVAESEITQKSAAIRLILTSFTHYIERHRFDKYSERGKTQIPILCLLDEFPLYGKLESIESAICTCRKKGVTIAVFIQSIAQLDKYYGVNGRRIILDNCKYQVILGASDLESQRYLSERIGDIIVTRRSYSESYNHLGTEPQGYTRQAGETRERIFQPNEFANLGNELVLITKDGFCKLVKNPSYFNNAKGE